ncbi:phosphoserine phosphatase 1 [Bacillus sp. 165]|uniref:phosphoserine phosphatase 1 n=1 Tax=Bacillus sp. 165 TaxID=1529117 RepID=UPI001ADA4503|nr:phosphoserine phosphatase 1 [Bacillus sp. 165]MBO9128151.1 phosphoserine phosphatase 1 [Bacillus sp. 165]
MKTRLYVTRHGETEWNVEKRMQGRMNSSLTERGKMQAHQLGVRMKSMPVDVIFSSPSERAVHTAELIRGERNIPIIQDNRFYEIHMGTWEGMNLEEIKAKYPNQFDLFWTHPHLYKTESGETFTEVQKRVLDGLFEVIEGNEGKNIFIVGHAVVSKLILGYFEDREIARVWEDPFMHSASLSIIDIENGEGSIVLYADTDHYKLNEED